MSTLSLRKIKHDSSAVDNITLDSSGNVGVNKTTPRATTGFNSVSLNGTDGSEIWFDANNSAATRLSGTANETRITAQASGSVITMFTGATERVRVDNSGRVTKPYQPSFHAYRSAGHVMGSGTTVIIWNSVVFDVGSNYNSSNGRFTAPVAGRYWFSTNGMVTGSSSGDHQLCIRKNGLQYNISNPGGVTAAAPFAAMGIIDLAVGDYVDCTYYDSSSATGLYASGGVWNHFCGYLIG